MVDCVVWWLGKEAFCDCEKCYRRKKGWEVTRMEEIRELVDGGDLGKIPRYAKGGDQLCEGGRVTSDIGIS